MLVVPLPRDIITTKDGAKLSVVTYTNFKSKGPAVYVEHKRGTPAVVIYFFDIDRINDVRVELSPSSKVFNALGNIKRKYHLPQPNDLVTLNINGENMIVEVKDLKLHSKNIGLSKGLVIRDKENNFYRMSDIVSIDRATGSDEFNQKRFLRLYSEYRGYSGK